MHDITGIPKYWSYKDLVNYYNKTTVDTRRERLLAILDWSIRNGAFIKSKNVFPSFGVRGRNRKRLISVWSPDFSHSSMPPGTIYVFINPVTKFDGSVDKRDEFINRLRNLKILGFDDISKNVAGINSRGPIDKLTKDEFAEFMAILDDFCFKKSKPN